MLKLVGRKTSTEELDAVASNYCPPSGVGSYTKYRSVKDLTKLNQGSGLHIEGSDLIALRPKIVVNKQCLLLKLCAPSLSKTTLNSVYSIMKFKSPEGALAESSYVIRLAQTACAYDCDDDNDEDEKTVASVAVEEEETVGGDDDDDDDEDEEDDEDFVGDDSDDDDEDDEDDDEDDEDD